MLAGFKAAARAVIKIAGAGLLDSRICLSSGAWKSRNRVNAANHRISSCPGVYVAIHKNEMAEPRP